MITSLRRSLDSIWVRGLFVILLLAFVLWGIGDVVRSIRGGAGGDWAIRADGQTVSPKEAKAAYDRQLRLAMRQFGGTIDPTPAIKHAVMGQTVGQLVQEALVRAEEARLHVNVPVSDVLQVIQDIPQFKGLDGKYNADRARAVLAQNGLTEAGFIQQVSDTAANSQLMESVRAGAAASDLLTTMIFKFQYETRSASMVVVPFAAQSAPAPTDTQLRRWYDNHPNLYREPEFRRVKAIVLTAESAGKDFTVSEADLKAAYQAEDDRFNQPEKRSVQIVTLPAEDAAKALAQAWQTGTAWPRIQDQAKAEGGQAQELTDASKPEIPDPSLARAVFAAPAGPIADIEHDAVGWHVFRVMVVTPPVTKSFEDAKDDLRKQLLTERGIGVLDDRAKKVDQLLGSGATLDEMPSDLGLVGVSGTLNAQGNTIDGTPAPIPGGPALRAALIAYAFQTAKGNPPSLQEVPAEQPNGPNSYYALTVEDVLPAALRPYAAVADQVKADWTQDALRHSANEVVTRIFTAVQAGQSLADAATIAGLRVEETAVTDRTNPPEGFPAPLVEPLFGLKPGEPVMVENGDSFLVAVPAQIIAADPAKQTQSYAEIRNSLTTAMADDIEISLVSGLRAKAQVETNKTVLDQIAQ
jgi:peptidyl-prolyl cis-trans isomerase D